MERGHRISRFELRRAVSHRSSDRVEYLDFYVDGIPIRQQLSFEEYDQLVAGPPISLLAKLLSLEAQRLHSFVSAPNATQAYGEFVKKAHGEEPSVIGHGPAEVQWEAINDLLLRGRARGKLRCKLFGCLSCSCHTLSTIVEVVDDCFVWHSFLSEYPWQSASVELGGGPFFFDCRSYTAALEGALEV